MDCVFLPSTLGLVKDMHEGPIGVGELYPWYPLSSIIDNPNTVQEVEAPLW